MDPEAEASPKNASPEFAELAKTVAQARFGLGVGDGLIAKGVGGGMATKPLGYIVIDQAGVRFRRTPQPSLALLALGVVPGLSLAIRLMRPPRAAG
jgi:hypothetical protein